MASALSAWRASVNPPWRPKPAKAREKHEKTAAAAGSGGSNLR